MVDALARLPRALADDMVAHARAELPNECCGIVATRGDSAVTVYRARNAEASPVRYVVHPGDLLRISTEIEESGLELGGIYHSHVRSPAYPSQTDVNLAQNWPDATYLIVSVANVEAPELRAFRIVDGQIDEVELTIA